MFRLFCLTGIVFSLYAGLALAGPSLGSYLRVRLKTDQSDFQIQGSKLNIETDRGNKVITETVTRISNNSTQALKIARTSGTQWKVVQNGKTSEVRSPYLVIKGSRLTSAAEDNPSKIILWPKKSNRFDVIGELELEKYLVGVVAQEMPLSWPMEALRAQAVIARSYALATARAHRKDSFDLESSVLDQMFKYSHQNKGSLLRAQAAVMSTEGQTLQLRGRTLKAFYHSDCGGETSSPRMVWGEGNDAGVHTDTNCPKNPKASWLFAVSKEQFQQKLRKFDPQWKQKGLQGIEGASINERKGSLIIRWSDGKTDRILANDLRAILGYANLRSAKFDVNQKDGDFTFQGIGFGHGVGLCQWGSRQWALGGKNYREILRLYYPKAQLFVPTHRQPPYTVSALE